MEASTSEIVSTKQNRIAALANERKKGQIFSLNQYLDLEWLKEAYRRTRKDGAIGVDEVTAEQYGENLEENLKDLLRRAHTGLYYAPPARRTYIPKAGNPKEKRPLGIPCFEDKVLQRAVVMILEPIMEAHFRECSFAYRPKRSPHQALGKVWKDTMQAPQGWVVDIDIKGYFDSIDKKRLKQFVAKWVQDGVINRLIGKWLKAGVMENNTISYTDKGTPQGSVISPLLSNLYLHHVLDMWFEFEMVPKLNYSAKLTRFADDAIIICQTKEDALNLLNQLQKRFEAFGLELHPEKTRIIQLNKPKTDKKEKADKTHFDFLGFTHYWGKSRKGKWIVQRKTQKKKFNCAVAKIAIWCKRNRQAPIEDQWKKLSQKVKGHYAYYGITGNAKGLSRFLFKVNQTWFKWLSRRDRSSGFTWSKMNTLLEKFPLPPIRVVHSVYAAKC